MTGLWLVSYIALWILFLLVGLVLLSVLRNLGVIYESVAKLAPQLEPSNTKLKAGELLPSITWLTISGNEVPLASFLGEKTAFSIVSPTCGPCRDLLRKIARAETGPDPLDPTVRTRMIVCIGEKHTAKAMLGEIGFENYEAVLFDPDNRVAHLWGVSATPATIIADSQLRVVRQIFGG